MAIEEFGYAQELKRALTTWDLVVYGMIFMVPIAPFSVFGYVWADSKGMVPLAYLVGMLGMFFTAMSYWAMSKAFPVAGSVYAYAQRGIHDAAGFVAGWLILLDYILVPALIYVVSAAALKAVQPAVPGWACIATLVLFNSLVNFFGIELTARINRWILAAELVVLALFIGFGLHALHAGPDAAGLSLKPIYDPANFSLSLVVGATSIAVLSFLGFDGISTLSEESLGDRDAVGRATLFSLLAIGLMFIVQTWIAADLAARIRFADPETAFYDVARVAGGGWLVNLTIWTTILAVGVANALAAQTAIARILYAMGRDRKLPALLARIHPRYGTPYVSTLLVALVSLAAGLYFNGHIDNLSRLVNFGALSGFLLLHLSVVNHYVVRGASRRWLVHLAFPAIGFAIIAFVIVEMDATAKELGLAWLALGVIYQLLMTRVFKRKVQLEL